MAMRPLSSFITFGLNLAFVGLCLVVVHAIMQPAEMQSPSYVKLGTKEPCTAMIAEEILPRPVKMGLRKWVEICEEGHAQNNQPAVKDAS
jgi:hypothetical protein